MKFFIYRLWQMNLLHKLTLKTQPSNFLIGLIVKTELDDTTSMRTLISLVDLKYFNCFIFIYSRNVVKAFYSAGMLLDVCAVFGELNEDVAQQKKYSLY